MANHLTGHLQSASHRELSRDWDIIVVGAGVLGTFHAYFASRRGLRTLLIERGDLPGEASVRNFGTLVPSAMTPGLWLRRANESILIYRELARQAGFPLQSDGTQYLATTTAEFAVLEEFARIGPAQGYECRLLTPKESVSLNPAIESVNCLASLHFPNDARVEPRGLLKTLIPWLTREAGCVYLPGTTVVGVAVEGGECLVRTASGARFSARHVFVCNGADLRTLFPERFAEAGLIRCKLQMLRTVPQRSVRLSATLASGLSIRWYPSFRICSNWNRLQDEPVDPELTRRGIHVLIVQDPDGRVVIGDSHEYSTADLGDNLDAGTEALILREAARLLHLPSWEVSERWHGVYCLHPETPLFEQTLDERIHLVSGIGGKGMTTAPAVARESLDGVC